MSEKEKLKIFIDSDVLKDVFFKPRSAKAGKAIAKLCETGMIEGCIASTAPLSIIEAVYSDKPVSADNLQTLFDSIGFLFSITDMRTPDLRKAQKNTKDNYMLALAATLADKEGAEYLVTGRTGKIRKCKAQIVSPQDFIDLYAKRLQEEAK